MNAKKMAVIAALFMSGIGNVLAHGGGLDANGCHFKRATGEYHCHRGGYVPPMQNPAQQPLQRQAQPNQLYSPAFSDTCYTGPRGGRYRIVNGRKRYGC
ncbi:MAG TPA: YHYH domain-containing protein [Azonexus sp.]|nr:YHYH domain-containing protein [Azonexus sp.]